MSVNAMVLRLDQGIGPVTAGLISECVLSVHGIGMDMVYWTAAIGGATMFAVSCRLIPFREYYCNPGLPRERSVNKQSVAGELPIRHE